MQKLFVHFYSPGTFFAEETRKPIDSWDVEKAKEMATSIKERYNAIPYGFCFSTRERTEDDLDSREIKRSQMYYFKGKIRTLAEVKKDNLNNESILRINMEGNGYKRVVTGNAPYRWTQPLNDDDVVLEQL